MSSKPSCGSEDRVSEDIVIECDLPQPPDKVWRAVTVHELLTAWLSAADLLPGAERAAPEGGSPEPLTTETLRRQTLSIETLSMEPQRRVRYRWTQEPEHSAGRCLESELSFELTPAAGGGTHLRIVHGSFRVSPVIRMQAAAPVLRARRRLLNSAMLLQDCWKQAA